MIGSSTKRSWNPPRGRSVRDIITAVATPRPEESGPLKSNANSGVWFAAIGAGAMIAHQVAAKAVRDAFFLSTYDVTRLPAMLVFAAVVSVVVVLACSRAMPRLGPVRLISASFVASALLLMGEWWLATVMPEAAAVVFYLHFAAFGAVLISGFWSVINEHFDPRTARKRISLIAAAGTLGGLLGGLAAQWASTRYAVPSLLPMLAVLHVFCGITVRFLPPLHAGTGGKSGNAVGDAAGSRGGLRVLAEVPYLQSLGTLVVMGTVSAALLDYVFKARATVAYTDGESLLGFFALFYTALSVASFLVQSLLGKLLLERLGLTRAVATFPFALAAGSLGALFVPGLGSAALARGGQAVAQNTLYRSGYELLFTPLPRHDKRATKTIIDVGFLRVGDGLGGALIALLLMLGTLAEPAILAGAAALAAVGVALALRLQKGYVASLEQSLLAQAVDLEDEDVTDAIQQSAILQTMGVKDMAALRTRLTHLEPSALDGGAPVTVPAPQPAVRGDVIANRLAELRTGDEDRVRAALRATLDRALVPQAISLLGWDPIAEDAAGALNRISNGHEGQLADALLGLDESFAVRRRVPRILGQLQSERATETLLAGLADRRFEVRFRCGRALARQNKRVDSHIDPQRVFAAVIREVSVDRKVWESYRLLDQLEDHEDPGFVDEVLKERANRGLEHVFTLLSLVLEAQPLIIAFKGLYTDDGALRGTALEYLEAVLPADVRKELWPFLEGNQRQDPSKRTREEIVEQLLRSNESIQLNLVAWQGRQRQEDS